MNVQPLILAVAMVASPARQVRSNSVNMLTGCGEQETVSYFHMDGSYHSVATYVRMSWTGKPVKDSPTLVGIVC